MTGSWKGRGNQYIQFVRVLYCQLPTDGKQLPAFPLEAIPGIEPRPQRLEARVLPLCHRGPKSQKELYLLLLDVSSLCTNIPNHEGILSVADHLRLDKSKTEIGPFILILLKLVLHSMNFKVSKHQYLQVGTTIIGTRAALNYANLVMERFETKALNDYPFKPMLWLNFIDDIFMIWTHGEDQLDQFIT